MLSNTRFNIHLGESPSKPQSMHNGLPQGSISVPALFSLYTADIPGTAAVKFIDADDIVLAMKAASLKATDTVMNNDLRTLAT